MGFKKPRRSDGAPWSATWVLVALAFAFGCQVDPLAPGVEGRVSAAKPSGAGGGNGNGGGGGGSGGGGGGPDGADLVFTIHDISGGIESDGDGTYHPAHPDIEAYISDRGQAVLFTNSGKKSGKKRDPERHFVMTMIDNASGDLVFDQDSVEVSAQTTDVVHILDDVGPGETVEIPHRIVFQANEGVYYLRFGRDCVENIMIEDERAQITRSVDGNSWTLESLPGRSARLCTSGYEDLLPDVTAHFRWEFSIAGGG